MKIGIISDIHANLAALETVLPRLADCDRILCAGDLINFGPQPEQTVQLAMTIPNLTAVRGNHESRILRQPMVCRKGPETLAHYEWTRSRLSASSLAWLQSLPPRRLLTLEGRSIALQHYGLREGGHCRRIRPEPTDADLLELFPEPADIVVFGHDHYGCIRSVGPTLSVNCGACGCPGRDRDLARAAILRLEETVTLEPLRLTYVAEAVVRQIRQLQYPDLPHILRAFYGL